MWGLKLCRHEWYGDGCPICEPMKWCLACEANRPAEGFAKHPWVGDWVCEECYRTLCFGCGARLETGVEEYCDTCMSEL